MLLEYLSAVDARTRDYLDGLKRAGRWNGEAPPPPLPDEVVRSTTARYREIYRRLTGRDIEVRR